MPGPFHQTQSGFYVPSGGWTPPQEAELSYWFPFTDDFADVGPYAIPTTPYGIQIAPDPDGGGFNCYHSQGGDDRLSLPQSSYPSSAFGNAEVTYGGWVRAAGWGGGGFGRINDCNGSGVATAKTFSNYINSVSGATGNVRHGYYHNSTASSQAVSSDDAIALDTWTHVMYTKRSGEQVIYINGVGEGFVYDTYASLQIGTGEILIGNRNDLIRAWEGQKRHYMCWKVVLTPAEINDVMTNTAP